MADDYTKQLAELNQHIHTAIPITTTMQIDATAYDGKSIRLQAPLAPNINDKKTGFAGSLAVIATFSGWCLLHIKLCELGINADIAVYKSDMRYIEPANSDFSSYTVFNNDSDIDSFVKELTDKGKAKIELTTLVNDEDKQVVELQGKYVAFTK